MEMNTLERREEENVGTDLVGKHYTTGKSNTIQIATIGSVRSGYPIEGAAALGFRYAFFAVHRA